MEKKKGQVIYVWDPKFSNPSQVSELLALCTKIIKLSCCVQYLFPWTLLKKHFTLAFVGGGNTAPFIAFFTHKITLLNNHL